MAIDLSKFTEILEALGEASQFIGVGVGGITGETTQRETLVNLRILQDLRKGRLTVKAQKELAVEFENVLNQPGATQGFAQSATGQISRTVQGPQQQQSIIFDPATGGFTPGPGLAKGTKTFTRKAPPKVPGGVETLSMQQLITDLSKEDISKNKVLKQQLEKELQKRLPNLTLQEIKDISTSGFDKFMKTLLKLIPTAGS